MDDEAVAPLPTVEEASDLNNRVIGMMVENQDRVRRLFRRWLILATVVLSAGVGYSSWQAHDSNATVGQVRTSQVQNTKVSNHRDNCAQTAYADLAYDLKVIVTPGETPKEFLSQIKIPGTKC